MPQRIRYLAFSERCGADSCYVAHRRRKVRFDTNFARNLDLAQVARAFVLKNRSFSVDSCHAHPPTFSMFIEHAANPTRGNGTGDELDSLCSLPHNGRAPAVARQSASDNSENARGTSCSLERMGRAVRSVHQLCPQGQRHEDGLRPGRDHRDGLCPHLAERAAQGVLRQEVDPRHAILAGRSQEGSAAIEGDARGAVGGILHERMVPPGMGGIPPRRAGAHLPRRSAHADLHRRPGRTRQSRSPGGEGMVGRHQQTQCCRRDLPLLAERARGPARADRRRALAATPAEHSGAG